MPFIRFETNGLLSKWGFNDGELLDELLYDHKCKNDSDGVFSAHQRVLMAVVRRYVVPALDQKDVVLMEIITSHNPIRAEFVGDVEINHYHERPNPELTPEFVEVREADILLIAHELGVYNGPVTIE